MATGTFTHNALYTKTLKGRIKTQKKLFKFHKSNAVSKGTTAVNISFYMPSGLSLVRKVPSLFLRWIKVIYPNTVTVLITFF